MVRIPNIRHMRRRTFAHLRNSKLAKKFVAYTAERTGMTESAVFEDLKAPGDAKEVSSFPNVSSGT